MENIMKKILVTLVALAAVSFALPAVADTEEQDMIKRGLKASSADESRKSVPDTTLCGEVPGGIQVCIYYDTDGKMYGDAMGSRAAGKYNVTDDGQMCSEWDNPMWANSCTKSYTDPKTNQTYSTDEDGEVTFISKTQEKGDPMELK
jgi:hypothetical protein